MITRSDNKNRKQHLKIINPTVDRYPQNYIKSNEILMESDLLEFIFKCVLEAG